MLYKLSSDLSFEADESGDFHLCRDEDNWLVPMRIFMETVAVFIAPTNLEDAIEVAADDAKSVLRELVAAGVLRPVAISRPDTRYSARAIAVNPACSQLVIYVSGNLIFTDQPINIFGTAHVYEVGDRNFVVLRDISCEQFRNGISDDVPSAPALISWLRGIIDGMPWIKELHILGQSSGGVAATMLGYYLNADTVTTLGLVKSKDSLAMKLGDGLEWDLCELLKNSNGKTEYHLYYGEHHVRDTKAAKELEGLPNVVLHGLDTDDHDVATVLFREGKLGSLLPPWRMSGEPTWRPPDNMGGPRGPQEVDPQAESKASIFSESTLDWVDGTVFENSSYSFVELFERQVAKTPNAIAVKSQDVRWTYLELNGYANGVAAALQKQGVQIETPVGVSVERSPNLVAALLGVLKSGGYYVAMEPTLPEARLRYILEDSGASVILTDRLGERALGGSAVECISMAACLQASTAENPGHECEPDALAYLLYTSGTTGKPKGVGVPQRALANHAEAFAVLLCDLSGESAGSRSFALKASYTFDLFVSELFPPLVAGASVSVVPPGVERQPDVLSSFIAEYGVTDLWTTPTMMRLLTGAVETNHGGSITRVFAAGEALTHDVLRSVKEQWGAEVWNLYGVTEMCAGQTGWNSSLETTEGSPPIGRALPNHSAALMSDRGEYVGVGEAAELVIGGIGEARGYRGKPGQTARAFFPDPNSIGGRLYASGDVGEWSSDGQIVYHGRADHQIQVCGVRVELSEIEGLLTKIQGVAHAAVLPVDEVAGRADGLEGFLVCVGVPPEPSDLREALSLSLADTVIPTTWHFLEEMPINTSGKIDRGALANLQQLEKPFDGVRARTDMERRVAAIWTELLGCDEISVEADFFDMGGTSVLVAFVRRQMDEELGVNVPDSLFFDRGTVESIAQYIDGVTKK